ncbi:MAG: hypothetical protein JXR31_07895, partial [Prolixibacteraceae bacterium]|nr:hypothetical protein [Prolixibacteraceae bacterium]
MKINIITGFILLFTFSNVFGQQFNYLRPQDGLYDGEINSIEQDESGLMWFATWSGLISYDGINFRSYQPEIGNPYSLPDKKIKKLFVDSKDNLWIITSRGLNLYDKENETFKTIGFDRRFSFLIDINYISEIDDNIIIHSLEGFYIYPLNKLNDPDYKAKKINIYDKQELIRFSSLSTALAGNLYLVTLQDNFRNSDVLVARLDTNNTGVYINVEKRISISDRVNSIEYVKPENNIYFATNNGIVAYSLKNNDFTRNIYFKGTVVRQIIYTSDYKLFCSTDNPELLYVDLHLGTAGRYIANPNRIGTLLNNNVHCLFEDFSGNLWIGHQGQGLSIKNLYLKEFNTFRRDPLDKNTLRSNIIMSFNGTNDEILIGCRTGGMNIIKKKFESVENPDYSVVTFRQPNGNRIGIWNIAKESETVFWIGTDNGLMKLVKSNGKWDFDYSEPPIYRGVVRKIFIDENRNLWCGTWRDGLLFIPALKNNPERKYYQYRMNPNNPESLTDNFIQCMTLDSKGRFWVGTVNGFNLLKSNYENLDLSGETEPQLEFKRYIAEKLTPGFLNNNEINCIFENYDGKMWIATQGGGINIFDPEKETFDYMTVADGLPGNDIQGILRDHMGKLWISTNKGLASYSHYKDDPEIK